jgi:uncharacterized membrane protein
MISFTNMIHVNRPAADVYDYLLDLEHIPEWNWAVTETKKATPGPAGVGSRYVQTRSVPRPGTEILEITALRTGRHIEVQGTLAGFAACLSYDLETTEGGTALTNTVTLEPDGALRLVAPLLGVQIRRAVADNLGQLKARLEYHEAPASHA